MSEAKAKAEPKPEKVKVMKPLKDANSMVYGWEEIEVDASKLEKKKVPGGLAAPIAY